MSDCEVPEVAKAAIECPHCMFNGEPDAYWSGRHLRADCRFCGRYIKHLKWSQPDTSASQEAMQAVWIDLLSTCEAKGYQRGWAAHTFKSKYGRWPNEAGVN